MTSHDAAASHRPSCRTSSTRAASGLRRRPRSSPQRDRGTGYRPDGLARSLRLGRSHAIGLVLPDTTNPFFAEMAQAVEDAAYVSGYAVLICTTSDDVERERAHIVNLASRRVDGLILMSARPDQDLSGFTGLGIRVVAMDRSPNDSPVSTIRINNALGARLGTKHLIEHGHQRIAIVAGPVVAGAPAPASMGSKERCPPQDCPGDRSSKRHSTSKRGHRAGHALLTTPDHPDALLILIGRPSHRSPQCGRRPRAASTRGPCRRLIRRNSRRCVRGSIAHVGRPANSRDGRTGGGPSARVR